MGKFFGILAKNGSFLLKFKFDVLLPILDLQILLTTL